MQNRMMMNKKIKSICKQIEQAPDNEKHIFPLLFELSKLKDKSPKEFKAIFLKIDNNLIKKASKYCIFNDKWQTYKKKRWEEENGA
jgi:hypothetical protein